ncbi:hypothetical protein LNV09_05265 [Paucibacter sp. B2R-40]|uniref:hypothetical protein n=1 Tax=Paucibacter sp. B2R-40 TaxID=2893554 RepID=UPI0021E3C617|nr:hypothetical protein [Paucibacter sp. B2R-40]MCV2353568.1 hypothetical protein [Paucibacter sp. B2R-40]
MTVNNSQKPLHSELRSRATRKRAEALAAYIQTAQEGFKGLAYDWEAPHWKGVGVFAKHGVVKGGPRTRGYDSSELFDPGFLDFAKAYIRTQHLQNPRESKAEQGSRLMGLRLVELALLELHEIADPLKIDRGVLDRATALAMKLHTGASCPKAGNAVQSMVQTLIAQGILPIELNGWTSPIRSHRNMGTTAGSEGDRARQQKLPSLEALQVLANIFNRDLDPEDDRHHRDIYTTSVVALLLSAPSRGQEIHRLPVNLEVKTTDRFGNEQTGLRLHASKGFGAYVKWVWSGMVPTALTAIKRLTLITEEARALARHLENAKTRNRFFRHSNCPAVADDEPLTAEQVCMALGKASTGSLSTAGLSTADCRHTLASLWKDWVLPLHEKKHPYFPYVSKKDQALGSKGGLKFSDALFCMRADQLSAHRTSMVTLWLPSLSSAFAFDVAPSRARGSVNIFDRYGYTSTDGKPLKLTSHQPRHLLNTEAQHVELPDDLIAHWSGRLSIKQNETYDNRPEQERVDHARPLIDEMDAQLAYRPSRTEEARPLQASHWSIDSGPKPRSCADLDIQPQLAGLKTEYGECHHDWAMAPCEGLVACLECSEHACIKGSDSTAQERLARIDRLHRQVLAEVEKAKTAVTQENWGAQEWLALQLRYATKLEQLISILQNPDVPDRSVIRLSHAQHPTHLHRVLRGIAERALADNSAPAHVMKQMLDALSNAEQGVQSITVHKPKQLSNPNKVASETVTDGS